jgi:hypothetical protein
MTYTRKQICKQCKKEFVPCRTNQKFCSRKCYGQYREIIAKENDRPYNRVSKQKICPICRKSFWEYPSRIKNTCSRKCSAKLISGDGNPNFKPKIKVPCLFCGKEMDVLPCLIHRKHFCDKECQYEWRSKNIRGEKVHNWKGGKGFGKYCPKFNFPFKERVRIFFKRKCFVCGCEEISERHHVHHIHFNPKACCDNSQREFVILCRSCHANTTNSIDREETARYYSMKLHEQTSGKCYYTEEEMDSLKERMNNLEKINRWDLSHLML